MSKQEVPKDHYRVHVVYEFHFNSILNRTWEMDHVSSVFFDGHVFSLDDSCVGMDRTSSDKVFYIHSPNVVWEGPEQIVWGLRQRSVIAPNGYRPATHEETHEFSFVHLELDDYIGLGSSVMIGDHRRVAMVTRNRESNQLEFFCTSLNCKKGSSMRVLFVAM